MLIFQVPYISVNVYTLSPEFNHHGDFVTSWFNTWYKLDPRFDLPVSLPKHYNDDMTYVPLPWAGATPKEDEQRKKNAGYKFYL